VQKGYDGLEVSSSLWVQAVTDSKITQGVIWGILLSSLFAFVSMYVFTGSVVVTALATVTMLCMNILVLGLYFAMGWKLGAIEGVSITVLVGLSVDFLLHFSEAFVMSRLPHRIDRARCDPSPRRPLANPRACMRCMH
jgi:predicted RND superfamily exporter protein